MDRILVLFTTRIHLAQDSPCLLSLKLPEVFFLCGGLMEEIGFYLHLWVSIVKKKKKSHVSSDAGNCPPGIFLWFLRAPDLWGPVTFLRASWSPEQTLPASYFWKFLFSLIMQHNHSWHNQSLSQLNVWVSTESRVQQSQSAQNSLEVMTGMTTSGVSPVV